MSCSAADFAASFDTRINIVATIDYNICSGIGRTVKESQSDLIIFNWPRHQGFIDRMINDATESIVGCTSKTTMICHLTRPLAMHRRVVVICPPLAEKEKGFRQWVRKMSRLSQELGIPLLIHWPGQPGGGTCDALTTSVDVHATLSDTFGTTPRHRTHGRSMRPLLEQQSRSIREWAIGGVFGNWVQVTDGRHKYARAAVDDNFPLSMWSNRWSTMPVHVAGVAGLPLPDGRAWLDRMPGSEVPVIRQPFHPGDALPFWVNGGNVGQHHLYDLDVDPDERENRVGESMQRTMDELLRTALRDLEAPAEQLQRLGL